MKRRSCLAVVVMILCLPACDRINVSQKRHRAIQQMNEGIEAHSNGRYADALRSLERAVAEDDSYIEAHFNLAKIYQEMDRWDDALPHLLRVTAAEPNNARAHLKLGMCYEKLNRPSDATASYQRALSLEPKLYVAHYRLGILAEAEGRPKVADAAYRRAIQINPRFAKPFVKLGMLYLDNEYPDLAMQVLQSGAAVNDQDAEIHNWLGVAYQVLKQYDRAVESFERALQLKPDLYSAMYNLGMVYAAADKRAQAEAMLTRFTKVAAGKKTVDQEYVRAAQEKISELQGVATGTVPPPAKAQ